MNNTLITNDLKSVIKYQWRALKKKKTFYNALNFAHSVITLKKLLDQNNYDFYGTQENTDNIFRKNGYSTNPAQHAAVAPFNFPLQGREDIC